MKATLRLATLLAAIFATSPVLAAGQQVFLAPQQAAAILADERPWSALDPDGTALKFTLMKDGTGSVRGPLPFALSITWAIKADAICIDGKMGTRCLQFSEIPGGLQGWEGEKPGLKFTR